VATQLQAPSWAAGLPAACGPSRSRGRAGLRGEPGSGRAAGMPGFNPTCDGKRQRGVGYFVLTPTKKKVECRK